jgi:PAS domain S-box-containing protein
MPSGEAFYQSVMESIRDHGIVLTDMQGIIRYWNEGAKTIFGYAPEEICGKSIAELFTPEDRDAKAPQKEMEEALATGRASDEGWHLRKEGSRCFVSGAIHVVRNGHVQGFVKVVRDETERKQMEAELVEAKGKADAASASKDHFIAVLSHELRTPLTPALATLGMLQGDPQLPEHLKHDIEVVHRNVELEARIIDDLLDYTRISRGKLHLNTGTVDVHSLIGHAMEMSRSELLDKKINISVDLNAEQHFVLGDAIRLQQVLWNLIKNAVKFTPEGGFITIHTFNTLDGRLKIKVTDTGIGIDPQRLPAIFEAFEQAERSITRQFGGLGLGLAIARTLTELHGGMLSAESKGAGEGATFLIDLPTTTERVRVVRQVPSRDALGPTVRPLRVLLVEDHEDTARIMARLLRSSRHQVTLAHNVASALAKAGSQQFDLLISDIGLPDGTGYELLEKVQKTATVRAVALTGFGMEEDVEKSLKAGFVAHLTKPVNFQRLETILHQIAEELDAAGEAETGEATETKPV